MTNLDSRDASETAVQFEKYRKALLLAWGGLLDPPGQVEFIILQNTSQLSEFADPPVSGFVALSPNGWKAVIAGSYAHLALPRVQLHELAHYLSHYVLLRQPTWVSEGLATYLETIEVSGEPPKAVLGKAHVDWLRYIRSYHWLSFEELWKFQRKNAAEHEIDLFYASAWIWVHYLINEQGPMFSDFQNRLAHAEEPRKAWAAAFARVSTNELERALSSYVYSGRYAIITYPLPVVPTEVKERPLKDAEVHVIRAQLHLLAHRKITAEEHRRLAAIEIGEALREESGNVNALILRAELNRDSKTRLAAAEELIKSNPDEPRVWTLYARVLDSQDRAADVERMLERAARVAPDDFLVLNRLACDERRVRLQGRLSDYEQRCIEKASTRAAE